MSELAIHPLSFGDDSRARLFVKERELFRGVYGHAADEVRDLLELPSVHRLVSAGLLAPAEIAERPDLDYPLVLRHPLVSRYSLPSEWCGPMLKDASLCFLDVATAVVRDGFLCLDAHPSNVIFDGVKPQYVDYGSFVRCVDRISGQPRMYHSGECFVRNFIRPLHLMERGYSPLARTLLGRGLAVSSRVVPDPSPLAMARSFLRGFLERHLSSSSVSRVGRALGTSGFPAVPGTEENFLSTLQQLREQVSGITFRRQQSPGRLNERSNEVHRSGRRERSALRNEAVRELVEHLPITSVTDLGCRKGECSLQFAQQGIPTVAIDSNESYIIELYEKAKRLNLPLTPLVMSVLRPTPTPALSSGEIVSVERRLAGDLVLALGLIQELVLSQQCDFILLAELLDLFSRRFVVLEFISREDPMLQRWRGRLPDWYTEDSLRSALGRRFRILRTGPAVDDGRILILLEKLHYATPQS
jgi:hypothetical protein